MNNFASIFTLLFDLYWTFYQLVLKNANFCVSIVYNMLSMNTAVTDFFEFTLLIQTDRFHIDIYLWDT